MPLLELPRLTVHGTPEQLGAAQGAAFAQQIRDFVPMRFDATLEYLATLGYTTVGPLVDVGRRCLAVYEGWHPQGFMEHVAIARAAGVDPGELYTAANMTDVRDVLALGQPQAAGTDETSCLFPILPADSEGCSALLLPGSMTADGLTIGAQTWDLNPQDLDYVVAIRRVPDQGPQTWSVTCTGCLSLVGINDAGLAVGTTNIKTRGSRVGVGYMGVLHRMLASRSFAEAAQACVSAPRAAAHTYWLASADQLAEWETTAWTAIRRDAVTSPLVRTNHCLVPEHSAREGEPPSASSRARLARLQDRLSAQGQSVDSVRALFADRSDGIDSVNRFAEDGQGTSTNSCVIAIPARREMFACRGSADRGEWIKLEF